MEQPESAFALKYALTWSEASRLQEILDEKNRAICLLSVKEAQRQRLKRRSVALSLKDSSKRMLCRQTSESQYDFTGLQPLPAGASPEDLCRLLVPETLLNVPAHFRKTGIICPCPETDGACIELWDGVIGSRFEIFLDFDQEDFFGLDPVELKGLALQGAIAPLLKMAIESQEP